MHLNMYFRSVLMIMKALQFAFNGDSEGTGVLSRALVPPLSPIIAVLCMLLHYMQSFRHQDQPVDSFQCIWHLKG